MTHIWFFLWGVIIWWAASLEFQSNRTARRWHNFPLFFFRSRTTRSNHQIQHFEIYLVSSIKSVMIPKQASTRHIKSNMQIFNFIALYWHAHCFSWDILFRWILFFSFLYRCFSLNDIRTMCGRGDEDDVVMKGGDWHSKYQSGGMLHFFDNLSSGTIFATIEMKYFFEDHWGDHTWE